MKRWLIPIICILVGATISATARENYAVEDVALPNDPDLNGNIDGLAVMPDGRVAVAFSFGKIYMLEPVSGDWQLFAEGLHNPLGIVPVDNHTLLVKQRPEISRIQDHDRDGVADEYAAVCDDFGMSGNYHEFHFGPVQDADGNLYSALGTASSGDGVRDEVRGAFYFNSPAYFNNPEIVPGPFKEMRDAFNRKRPGRMYAATPFRGWVIKVTPNGEMIPWASGLRTPNGLGFDLDGNLFATDNQGDWLGTSKLHHIKKGRFHGHPASLAWKPSFTGDPLAVPVSELDAMRTRACVLFPQGVMANSPTQPRVDDTQGKFGPFSGQLLVGEMNKPRIMRVMLEEVGGELQGACIPFFDGAKLATGNNRLDFDASGALWVGHTKHTWAGGSGLQRIRWDGETPFDLLKMNLSEKGFKLTFTEPLDPAVAALPDTWEFKRYYYAYHEAYGSKQFDVVEVPVTKVTLANDNREVWVELASLKAWHVHELSMKGVKSAGGRTLENTYTAYTLNRLLGDTPPPPVSQQGTSSADKRKVVKPWAVGASPDTSDSTKPRKNPEAGVYEAESAKLAGVNRASKNPGWYGDGFADCGNAKGASIAWKVSVKEAGAYQLRFRYAVAGTERPLALYIDERLVEQRLPFKGTGSWSAWKHETVDVKLGKGKHVVKLVSVENTGPNIDSLQILKK